MSLDRDPSPPWRAHPYLVGYAVVLVVTWVASIVTWTVPDGRTPELHPVAQAAQYLLVLVASTLAALQLRAHPGDGGAGATLGFYELRWSISDDVGARSFWTAVRIGALAMLVNVAILVVADLVVSGGAAGIGAYLAWIGAAVAAGGVIGMFGALIALAAAPVLRRMRRPA